MPREEKKYYSKQDSWFLFLVCAFPLHLWALLLSFRDISWVAERTNFWDAIGVVSYGLIFAFLESLFLFPLALLGGMLIPLRWGRNKRLAITGTLFIVLAIWAMTSQLYTLQNWNIPGAISVFLASSAHPLRYIYAITLAFVVPSVVLPILMIYKSERISSIMLDLIDRISLLTLFYLLLDLAALITILARNI